MNRNISLKKNHDIEKLVKQQKSVGNKYYSIYYQNMSNLKIAFSISKKIGKAHFRNYQKRVTKEIVRKNIELIKNKWILIVIKMKSIELNFDDKEKEIKKLLTKMRMND